MILGHCMNVPGPVGRLLGAFHMPLFFIASGLLFKPKEYGTIFKNTALKVLVPYFTTALIMYLLISCFEGNYDWWPAILLGNSYKTFGMDGYNVGPLWFLPAFFCSMLFINIVVKLKYKWTQLTLLVGSFYLSLLIFYYCDMLPFGVLPGIVGSFFIWVGIQFKEYDLSQHKNVVALLALSGIACCFVGDCAMSWHIYKLQLVQIMGAAGCVYFILNAIRKYQWGGQLSYVGRNSLALMCIHAFDRRLGFTASLVNYVSIDNRYLALSSEFILKVIFVFLLFMIIKRISFTRNLYKIID